MGYITNAEIERRLGSPAYVQLTDDADTGVADAAVVDEARLAAEGEVNSYLARRVSVPVDLSRYAASVDAIRSAAMDLAAYRLHLRRPPVPADIVRRRREAVAWLEGVANGSVMLESVTDSATTDGMISGPPRVMTRDSLDNL